MGTPVLSVTKRVENQVECPYGNPILPGLVRGRPRLSRRDLLLLLIYLFIALRVVYQESRVQTLVKALVVTLADTLLFVASIGIAAGIAIIAVLLGSH